MRIRELTLHNYRAFGECRPFAFASSFTVVAGVNGRGKTAILEGIALLASRFLPLVSPARSGYFPVSPSDVHGESPAAELTMKANCAGIPVEFGLKFAREERKLARTRSLPPAVRKDIRFAYGIPDTALDAAPLVVYYTTDRAGYRLPKAMPTAVPKGQAGAYRGALRNRTVDFRDFMARYRADVTLAGEAAHQNPYFIGQRAVGAIGRVVAAFLEGFSGLRVEEEPLRLLIDKSGVSLDLSQLSDGERSFLALGCDLGRRLALANPGLEDPLAGAGVVLIDELELHLHPRWQREVIEKLRGTFPNIQFIGTTHSPFVIQSLRPGELINLDPDEFGEYADKSIEDIAENVMGVDLPQKSERHRLLLQAGEVYFRLLRDPSASEDRIAAAERDLNAAAGPFSDDPAFQAFLNVERETRRGGSNEAR